MYNYNVIYHVYNQSNNYEPLFRCEENYRYFTRKIKRHLLPYANIFCYCLMPDHFHFLLKPTVTGCAPSRSKRYLRLEESAAGVAYQQNLSNAIKTLLSSYTLAINKRYGRRGSLFKSNTKAKPGYTDFYPDASEFEEEQPFTLFIPYLRVCFHYIHDNPVKARLVPTATEWEFSSALDYSGLRDTGVCNFKLTEKLLGIPRGVPYRRPTL
ncbi:transposase [Neolewinella sp.]|uniref:transposase n=1 Tax=Neolewinella sp. TaxID=2993543 RepID=UPI003B52429C